MLNENWAMVVLGCCKMVAGICALALPETLGTLLVERIEDVHELKQDGKPFFAWWSKATLQQHTDDIMHKRKSRIEETA